MIKSIKVLPILLLTAAGTPAPFTLVDMTKEAGLGDFFNLQGSRDKLFVLESTGGGAAFFDYNNDGWPDVLLVSGSTIKNYKEGGGDPVCRLYRNNRDGSFTDVTTAANLQASGWGQGVAIADFDNDGWRDVYVTGYGRNFLFRNQADGTFSDVTVKSGTLAPDWSIGAAWGDYNQDGFLDLYVCNYLDFDTRSPPFKNAACTYKGIEMFCGPRGLPGSRDTLFRNNGDGTFTDVTDQLGIDSERLYGMGAIFADFDNDGDPDLFVANDLTRNYLYENKEDGTFTETGLLRGVAYDEDGVEEGSMGVDFGDYDGNGYLDLFYTNASYQGNALLKNSGTGFFQNVTYTSGQGQVSWLYVGWGAALVDLDNDSALDLFVVNGHLYPEANRLDMGITYDQRPLVFQNDRKGNFVEVGPQSGAAVNVRRSSRGAAFGDYDNDGRIDVLVNNLDGPPLLLRNSSGNDHHWLLVALKGTKSNQDAVGARLELNAGGRKQIREVIAGSSYASTNDIRVHFGLEQYQVADELKIRWPSGNVQTITNISSNQVLAIQEER